MADYDLFNGDADGICALTQLRLAEPRDSELITGVKRDIQLLEKIQPVAGDRVTALDISFDKNRAGVDAVLQAGAELFYVDHHFAGDIPENDRLQTIINTASDVCTSLLVNQYLDSRFLAWAVVGTFGDNLHKSARLLARPLSLAESQLQALENLGTYINYNGYGSALEDLHFHPRDLYRLVSPFKDPFDFMHDARDAFEKLEGGYQQDMTEAQALKPVMETDSAAIFMLPNEPWARRVSGVYSNDLANASPDRAHAVLTEKANGNYLVSVRAPLNNKTGADELCRQFPSGGGRQAAAGINDLPASSLDEFRKSFSEFYR